jgi:hypothetical protein
MPLLLRTRLTAVEPSAIFCSRAEARASTALTVQGKARVRVRGSAYGVVCLGGQLRWAFGAFDETFHIARANGKAHVMVLGLGGVATSEVRFTADRDLTVRRPAAVLRRTRWSRVHIPPLPALSAHSIQQGPSEHERD